jgi:hypothetical protein
LRAVSSPSRCDATGAIYSAGEMIAEKGLFRAFYNYTDQDSHYLHPSKAGGKIDKD